MSEDHEYLKRLVEATEWFDWMRRKMRDRRIAQLDEEATVLIAMTAVEYANELEPTYGRGLPKQLRSRLIKRCIINLTCRCFEEPECGGFRFRNADHVVGHSRILPLSSISLVGNPSRPITQEGLYFPGERSPIRACINRDSKDLEGHVRLPKSCKELQDASNAD
jgi:hypothetical protein